MKVRLFERSGGIERRRPSQREGARTHLEPEKGNKERIGVTGSPMHLIPSVVHGSPYMALQEITIQQTNTTVLVLSTTKN